MMRARWEGWERKRKGGRKGVGEVVEMKRKGRGVEGIGKKREGAIKKK